jgi:DNA replication protein DnaC
VSDLTFCPSPATAILDRFLHHAEVIAITGRSYRLKDQAGRKEDCEAERETVK